MRNFSQKCKKKVRGNFSQSGKGERKLLTKKVKGERKFLKKKVKMFPR